MVLQTSDSRPAASGTAVKKLRACCRAPWLAALVLFVCCVVLYTGNNSIPFYYHPDEPGKVDQIVHRFRNFHHPLLLLTATEMTMWLGWIERTPQHVVEAGRFVAAVFAAASVACLFLLAFYRAGWLAAVPVGVIAALHAELFKLAHYMKEDPPLMFGLALTFLAMQIFWREKSTRTLRFLAVACAVAASGKYLGFIAPLLALPLVWFPNCDTLPANKRARLKTFGGAFGIALAVINYSFFIHPDKLFRSLVRETGGAVGGHRGLTRSVPHTEYVTTFLIDTTWPIWVFGGACLLIWIATWRRRNPVDWIVALFPIAYVVMLSFSPKISERYLLPVTTMACFLAGMGIFELASLILPSKKTWLVAARGLLVASLLALTVKLEMPRLIASYRDYEANDRREFYIWIETHLPKDAVIAQDDRVNLPDLTRWQHEGEKPLPQKVIGEEFVGDLGTLDELKKQGVTHVAVCDGTFGRFFAGLTPQSSRREEFLRRKAFYEQLFKEGQLIWQRPVGAVIYLRPGLKLYRIASPEPAAER